MWTLQQHSILIHNHKQQYLPQFHLLTTTIPMSINQNKEILVKHHSIKSKSGGENNETQSVPVHYPTHWWCRGEELKKLTAVEYAALVDILPLKKESSKTNVDGGGDEDEEEDDDNDLVDAQQENKTASKKRPRGRKQRRVFRFHKSHPLYHSHGQFLRAKQPTLIFNAHPPTFPGDPPSKPSLPASCYEHETYQEEYKRWFHKATEFARFYTICFLPHEDIYGDNDTRPLPITWKKFCSRIQSMESSGLLIDQLRLDNMMTFISSLSSNYKSRILLSNYRHRCSTKWSDKERLEADELFQKLGRKQQYFQGSDLEDLVTGRLTTQVFSSNKIKDTRNNLNYCKDQMRSIASLFRQPATKDNNNNNNNHTEEQCNDPRTAQQQPAPGGTSDDQRIDASPDKILLFETGQTHKIAKGLQTTYLPPENKQQSSAAVVVVVHLLRSKHNLSYFPTNANVMALLWIYALR